MTDNIFYDVFVRTMCKIAQDFTPTAISSENWKVIGQHPEIMVKILEAGVETYKNPTYIQKFYEENPELLGNAELAKKFLFCISEERAVDTIFNLFPNNTECFFENISEVADWLKKKPLLLSYRHFDSLRKNKELFSQMQSCDNLDLSWFNLPCPDNPEKINAWLEHKPTNFNHLPKKYQHDKELFFQVLVNAGTQQEKVFRNAPTDMQELLETNCILARSGNYQLIKEKMQVQVPVFFSYCECIKSNHDINNIEFLAPLGDDIWKEGKNISMVLQTISQVNLKGNMFKHYETLLSKLRTFKKIDSDMETLLDTVGSDGQPLYHLGMKMNEVRLSYSDGEVYRYFKTGLKDLEQAYRITLYAKEMDRNLPHKSDAIKVKKAKI